MRDLAVLVADANMKAAMEAILVRDSALGIRKLQFDITVHPRRDPGCFHEGPDFLRGFRPSHEHALLVLDRAFAGAPLQAAEIERKLSRDFEERRFGGWHTPL